MMLGKLGRWGGAGAIALVAAGGGIALATIPGGDGTISGCYAKTDGLALSGAHSKGDLRAVVAGESCRSYEAPLAWSVRGPQGDPGATGAAGPAGPGGMSGMEVVETVSASSTDSIQGVGARCPAGKVATGGGGSISGSGGVEAALLDSHVDGDGRGWHVRARSFQPVPRDPWQVGASVICVDG
ncbi:MAG: hypothetical protein QOI80_3211 [Solirubrobacteraceae bacterium]|jgi:hypothetical protein|nr:hypothetical protein [Solirubrobacteraceae bacterium]